MKNLYKNYITWMMFYGFTCILISSCSIDNDGRPLKESNQDSKDQVPKSKLTKKLELYNFDLKVKTPEMMAKQELKNQEYDSVLYEKTLGYFQNMYYFTFSIRRTDSNNDIVKCYGNSEDERTKIITYLSFEMQNNCKLITENDTLPCKIYHYERNYGVSPFTNISLGFEKNEKAKNVLAFIYQDKFFGNKDLVFDLKNSVE